MAETTEIQEREIEFDQAVAEEAPPEAEAASPAEEEDVVEILEPKIDPKTWKIGKDDYERVYVQRPLSFMAKMQWFSLVGDVLDKALSGETRMSLNSLFTAPATGRDGTLSLADFRDADTFMQALGKLLSYAPEFLLDSYVIWLGVPAHERPLVKQIMLLTEQEGGLSDEQGIEIIEIFIDQNYDALDAFFRQRIAELRKRVDQRQKAAKASRQSKR